MARGPGRCLSEEMKKLLAGLCSLRGIIRVDQGVIFFVVWTTLTGRRKREAVDAV